MLAISVDNSARDSLRFPYFCIVSRLTSEKAVQLREARDDLLSLLSLSFFFSSEKLLTYFNHQTNKQRNIAYVMTNELQTKQILTSLLLTHFRNSL